MLSICCTVVVEEFVICTDLSVNFVHVLLNDCRKSVVVGVSCLFNLEEDIRVLSRTTLMRVVRVKSFHTELMDSIEISHLFEIFIIPCLDLLDLVGCTETIEEVDEASFTFDCCKVSNRC